MMNQPFSRKTKSPPARQSTKGALYKSPNTLQKRPVTSLAGAVANLRPLAKSSSKTIKPAPAKKLKSSFEQSYQHDTTEVHRTPSAIGRASYEENLQSRKHKGSQRAVSPKAEHLSDEVTLRHRVMSLEKNFETQAKVLQELDQKISSEKLEISQLSQQISAKKQKEDQLRREEEARKYQQDDAEEPNARFEQNILRSAKLAIHEVESPQGKYSTLPKTRAMSGDQSSTGAIDRGQLDRVVSAEENYKYKWLHLKDYVNTIEGHYELKISEMKREIDRLTEENYRLKYRHGSSTGDVNEQYFNNLDSIYKKKIAKAEARYEEKEKEIIDKEISFKQEIENLNARIRELQIELNSKARVDEKVKELKSQLSLREKEISSLKTFYAEKLKMKADEIASIKAEHSRVQQEYLDEIRELRREIDRMAYDSKRLALSHSNKTTHALLSSLAT